MIPAWALSISTRFPLPEECAEMRAALRATTAAVKASDSFLCGGASGRDSLWEVPSQERIERSTPQRTERRKFILEPLGDSGGMQ